MNTAHILSYQLCSKFDCFRRSTESNPRYHVLNLDQVIDSGGVFYKRISFSKLPPLIFHNTLFFTPIPSILFHTFLIMTKRGRTEIKYFNDKVSYVCPDCSDINNKYFNQGEFAQTFLFSKFNCSDIK